MPGGANLMHPKDLYEKVETAACRIVPLLLRYIEVYKLPQ